MSFADQVSGIGVSAMGLQASMLQNRTNSVLVSLGLVLLALLGVAWFCLALQGLALLGFAWLNMALLGFAWLNMA